MTAPGGPSPSANPREKSSVTLAYQRLLALPHADRPIASCDPPEGCSSAVAAEKCLGGPTLPLPDLVARALPGPRPTPGRERPPLQ